MDEISRRDAEFRAEVRVALRDIQRDVKRLIAFRAWLIGLGTAAGAIGGFVFNLIFK